MTMTFGEGLADIGSALGALQKASDIIRAWTTLATDKERASKLSELNRQILAAQTSAIQANAAQASLIEQIGALKTEIARLETWDSEKERYRLCNVAIGAPAYVLKKDSSGGEPPHWLCTDCYQHREKSILKNAGRADKSGMDSHKILWKCHGCGSSIRISYAIQPKFAEETVETQEGL